MSSLEADLYLDQIDIKRYCAHDVSNLNEQCQSGEITCLNNCPLINPQQREVLKIVLGAKEYLPSIPTMSVPQPVEPDLIALNKPDNNSLVLITANNALTVEVLTTIWAQVTTPAYLLLIDCLGNTVDMAMVFGEFKPERLKQAIDLHRLEGIVTHRRMIVPGLTASLANEFQKATGWEIEVGPICAAELPLFLGDRWVF